MNETSTGEGRCHRLRLFRFGAIFNYSCVTIYITLADKKEKMKTKTAWGMEVDIPNCNVCNTWLGKGNIIVKGSCGNFFHQKCTKKKETNWKVVDRVDLIHDEWWIVEKFWEYFKNE